MKFCLQIFFLFYALTKAKEDEKMVDNLNNLEDGKTRSDDFTDSVGLMSVSTEKMFEEMDTSEFNSAVLMSNQESEFL
ncbi:hypothetical protein TUBRATIS_001950 [Tubulinosema ratisbonensis]|uniref:Uncharacterized protein n=1 Tax=Tubulinosema ratisbonensis TaxID=291195 RepID=A0A437AQN1_9MICR|nr:hypothetical protein TUBRATIS_001950 [Tubulinosema ratisbonensis]